MSEKPPDAAHEGNSPGDPERAEEDGKIALLLRFSLACHDPEVREATKALLRTLANLGISGLDTIPVLGDSFSWMADFMKFFRKTNFLTPDVPWGTAIGSEVLEAFPGMPSHIVEGLLQLRKDRPRLWAGLKRLLEILKAEQAESVDHAAEIDKAMETFTDE